MLSESLELYTDRGPTFTDMRTGLISMTLLNSASNILYTKERVEIFKILIIVYGLFRFSTVYLNIECRYWAPLRSKTGSTFHGELRREAATHAFAHHCMTLQPITTVRLVTGAYFQPPSEFDRNLYKTWTPPEALSGVSLHFHVFLINWKSKDLSWSFIPEKILYDGLQARTSS